jgi:hypothetical protein
VNLPKSKRGVGFYWLNLSLGVLRLQGRRRRIYDQFFYNNIIKLHGLGDQDAPDRDNPIELQAFGKLSQPNPSSSTA